MIQVKSGYESVKIVEIRRNMKTPSSLANQYIPCVRNMTKKTSCIKIGLKGGQNDWTEIVNASFLKNTNEKLCIFRWKSDLVG